MSTLTSCAASVVMSIFRPTIERCPFCDGDGAELEQLRADPPLHCVRCKVCGASGPTTDNRQAAGRMWDAWRSGEK